MYEESKATVEMKEIPKTNHPSPDSKLETNTSAGSKTTLSAIGYLQVLLKDSVVTGVSQIVTAPNLFRKIFKLIILISCIVGFVYQTVNFLNLYCTYPSTLEIELKHEKELPRPAVTVCNRNAVQRKRFCEENKDLCIAPKNLTNFCKMYPTYCEGDIDINNLKFSTYDEIYRFLDYAQEAKDLIYDCCLSIKRVKDECSEKAVQSTYLNEMKRDRNCYTIDFSKMHPQPLNRTETAFNKISCYLLNPLEIDEIYTVILTLNREEYLRPDFTPSAQISVHSSEETVNPFVRGFNVEIGKRYVVMLSAIEEQLLPAPYSTNCVSNYKDVGTRTRDKCLDNCVTKVIAEECGCEPEDVFNETPDIKGCSTEEDAMCMLTTNYSGCYHTCPRLCHSINFKYEVSSSKIEPFFPIFDLGDGIVSSTEKSEENILRQSKLQKVANQLTIINLVYAKQELTLHTYKPKYENLEILGYIGGYSGIWLGISLVAVCDFFETLTLVFFFVCKKRRQKITINE